MAEQEPTTFGEFVSFRLRKAGLTQAALAEGCDLSQSYVSKVILGRLTVGSYAMVKILHNFGINDPREVERFFLSPKEISLNNGINEALSILPPFIGAAYSRLNPKFEEREFALKLFTAAVAESQKIKYE